MLLINDFAALNKGLNLRVNALGEYAWVLSR